MIHSWQQEPHVGSTHTGSNRFPMSLQEGCYRSDFAVGVRRDSRLPGSHNTSPRVYCSIHRLHIPLESSEFTDSWTLDLVHSGSGGSNPGRGVNITTMGEPLCDTRDRECINASVSGSPVMPLAGRLRGSCSSSSGWVLLTEHLVGVFSPRHTGRLYTAFLCRFHESPVHKADTAIIIPT